MSWVLADISQPPRFGFLYETGSYICWLLAFAVLLGNSIRKRRVNPWLIYLFAFTTQFWQDFFGGWGGYFLYNPRFARMEWWGHMRWTSPNKPWFLIAAYGWWWTFAIGVSSIFLVWLRKKKPNWSLPVAFALTCGAFFYLYDVVAETAMVYFHWQDYTMGDPFGLEIHTSNGTFPLLWPLIPQIIWIYAVVWLVTVRNDDGVLKYEAWLHLDRFKRWRLQIARFFAYAAAFNVTYALILIIPMMLLRAIQGDPSMLVP